MKDTAKALHDAKLACAARMGTDTSCVKSPNNKTVSACHSMLMSAPEITQQCGDYTLEHLDDVELSEQSMLSDLTGTASKKPTSVN